MKKLLLSILCVLLLVGCGKKSVSDKPYMVTLDINPTIELEVEGMKVNRINPEGNEAWALIDRDFEGKSLTEVFDEMFKHLKEQGYLDENDDITIIVGIEENEQNIRSDKKTIEDYLRECGAKKNISLTIIQPEITEEAKKAAEEHGVTPAKAAVILETLEGNEELNFEDIKEKSARELKDMKETGLYCDLGYTLRGDKCEKRERDEAPKEGKTCPETYEEIKGKCYKIGPSNHEPSCKEGELKEDKCVITEEVAATAKCSEGTYNSKTKKCEKLTYAGEGEKKCSGDNPKISAKGTCTYPKPTINGGCEGSDQLIDGWCYNMKDGGDQYPTVTCPSGQTVKDGKCYTSETSAATYTCSKGELNGDKCKVETTKDPVLKVTCFNGLTSYKDRACIDYKNTVDYIVGLICPGGGRLEGDRCVYYDVVDAKGK